MRSIYVSALAALGLAGAAKAGTNAAGHLLFQAHEAGGALFGTDPGGVFHHHGGAADQHGIVICRVIQLGHKAVEAHRAGIGGDLYHICDGAVLLHAVGGIPEAEEHVRLNTGSCQFPGDLIHGGGANAAAHHGDLFVCGGEGLHIKSVAHGAGNADHIAFFQLGKLFGALALYLIQKFQRLLPGIKAVQADGAA